MTSPALHPLSCPKCGAPVPLGEGDVARCSFCAIDVPVPAEYIALRDDANTRRKDRGELDRLYAAASRPPSLLVRGFAAIGDAVGIAALIGGGLIILGTIIGVIIREQDLMTTAISAVLMIVLAIPAFIETMFHFAAARSYDLYDALGAFSGVLAGLLVWLLVAAPILISQTCRGALAAIIGLRRRLVAGSPVQPGGPATCRSCGAALDVPAGALGVPCTYCGADNLVAIPDVVATAEHQKSDRLHHDVAAVLQDHRKQLAAHRRKLRRRLAGWLFGLACAFEALYFPSHGFLDGMFTMVHRASSHRGALYPDDDGNPVVPSDGAQAFDIGFPYRCHDDHAHRCTHFYLALQRGDRVTFETPGRTDLGFALQRHEHLVLSVGVWEPWITDASLAARAPYTGWYRVQVTAPMALDRATTTLRWTTRAQ